MKFTRRTLLGSLGAGAVVHGTEVPAAAPASACEQSTLTDARTTWARGIEGQRKADLGDGTFLNPILAGDHPDPTILKDGNDYYMTFSSFDAYPGIVIWHSRDLVNWQPITAALRKPVGSVWACDLVKYQRRYYIYFPARSPERRSNYVIHADDIRGPWSDPIDLSLPNHIDPGHIVGEDRKRYLFLSGGDRVRLTDDGLATASKVEHVYDPWRYPEDWVVESFSPEGPKLLKHGEYFYMILAIGGTAGPPTRHMVIAARSRSIHGPWEHCPRNPLVRTQSVSEQWWSRSCHDRRRTGSKLVGGLSRLREQVLDARSADAARPIEWTDDGWFRAQGGDLSQPIAKPASGSTVPHGMALSDDFTSNKFGVQWGFYDPGANEVERVRYEDGVLLLAGKGEQPHDSSPLTFIAGDQHYRVTADLEIDHTTRAGLLLFYNRRLYCGLGFDRDGLIMHRYGLERRMRFNDERDTPPPQRLWLRVTNDRHIVTFHYSRDGRAWTKFDVQMEVSGYHHNVAYDFLSLRPALYAAERGVVKVRDVRYEAL